MPTNKFIPSIPENADPSMRTHLRQLWDRLNFTLDEIERIKQGDGGQVSAISSQVSRLNVAIAAVQDNLARQNTYVDFAGTTTVDGVNATGQTGFAVVDNGNWSFISNQDATNRLSVFTAYSKGLVPNPNGATGFLSSNGTWQTVNTNLTRPIAYAWFIS